MIKITWVPRNRLLINIAFVFMINIWLNKNIVYAEGFTFIYPTVTIPEPEAFSFRTPSTIYDEMNGPNTHTSTDNESDSETDNKSDTSTDSKSSSESDYTLESEVLASYPPINLYSDFIDHLMQSQTSNITEMIKASMSFMAEQFPKELLAESIEDINSETSLMNLYTTLADNMIDYNNDNRGTYVAFRTAIICYNVSLINNAQVTDEIFLETSSLINNSLAS